MKPAIACIPDCYMRLTLESDAWSVFLSVVVVIIAAMQAFERAMLAAFERIVLWPFIQIRRTVHHSDSLMVEYLSATCAGLMALWVAFGRDNSVAHHLMTARIPEWFWIAISSALSLAQFVSAAHGSLSNRAACAVFATGLWALVTLILILRVGFSLAHVFSLPMVLACWLSIFILIAKGQHHGPIASAE